MLYSDSLRKMMQKRIDESFWDGLGVEIEACADFPPKVGFRENFPGPGKKSRAEKIFSVSMLWVWGTPNLKETSPPTHAMAI